MYLDSIALTKTLPCLAEPGRIIVIGKPNRLLDEVIPYLATLPGVIAYNPETRTLTFRRPHGFMTLYTDKVYITQVVDAAEGLQLFEALKEAVNTVWEKREELAAVMKPKSAPRHLDIWSLLPQTNCRQCGEATCYSFALKLAVSQKKLADCPPLSEPQYAEKRAALEEIVIEAPAIVGRD